jgi:gliding motility-associated-like protein
LFNEKNVTPMKNKRSTQWNSTKWIAAWLLLLCSCVPALAQFVNGDFSMGTNGCAAGPGWTGSTGVMAPQRTETYQAGNPWLDLTPCGGWGNGTWIEQAVPTIIGNHYRIDFDIASHCGWDGSHAGVYITLNGQQLCDPIFTDTVVCPPPLGWQRRSTVAFTATTNPTVVRFTGEGRCRDFRTGAYPCNGPGALGNPGVIALDNIVLVQVPSGQVTQASLGNDTLYCGPFTRVLDPGSSGTGFSYLWNTGDTTSTLTVTTPGTYWVTVNSSCGTASDTIRIDQGTVPPVDLGADIQACKGNPVTLQSSIPAPSGAQLVWSTGSSAQTISVNQTGDYWLEVRHAGCIGRDTVHVEMVDISVDLGPDISLCDRDTPIVLTSTQPAGAHYVWSNGLSTQQMSVSRSGRYWLEVTLDDCRSSDTVMVDIVPTPSVFAGADTTICEQFPHTIGAEIPTATYSWNTGATTPYISVNRTGTYVEEVKLRGCVVYDTVEIIAMPIPEIDLGGDRDICTDQTIALDGSFGSGSSYLWNTGETTSSISVSTPGTYGVRVTTEHHCVGGDTVTLSHYPHPTVILPGDTSVCEEEPLWLVPYQQTADSLLWSDGSVGDGLSVRYAGEYIVTAVNKCGTGSDTILVKQIVCDIWVPNAFSPNGDGSNDVFRVLGNTARIRGFGMSIYNRWGQRIFHTNDKYKGWDGTDNGTPAATGTYMYMVEYMIGDVPYLRKGDFHLVR